MRLSTWLRHAGSKKTPRLTYAPGHPAYQFLMQQVLSRHAAGDEALLHLDFSSRWKASLTAVLPYRRMIFLKARQEDSEKVYHFLRHVWKPQDFPSDYVVIFAPEADASCVDIAKSSRCYVDTEVQPESETRRVIDLLLGKPPEALTEYCYSRTGNNPLTVVQTIRTLSYMPQLSKRAIDFAVYQQDSLSFEESLYCRDFGSCWDKFTTLTHTEKSATISRVYSRFQDLRYVKREQPRMSYQRGAFPGMSVARAEEAYRFVPQYTDTQIAAIENALVSAYQWLPKFPDRAVVSLLTAWPK